MNDYADKPNVQFIPVKLLSKIRPQAALEGKKGEVELNVSQDDYLNNDAIGFVFGGTASPEGLPFDFFGIFRKLFPLEDLLELGLRGGLVLEPELEDLACRAD
ncbi:hypothetical protein TWF173_001114 [Orbilia oligospora]|nr:hypothetical protein TWF173_001114 [Orbilia oligospora]